MAKAIAFLRGKSPVTGAVTFEQQSETSPTIISWHIYGNDANVQRAFHIHEFGDNTNGCTSAGPHSLSTGSHGGPADESRHVGDLGNFQTDSNGVSKGTLEDYLVRLIGHQSVVGRTMVVHAGTDDLGRGGNSESKATGDAKGRAACGEFCPYTH